MAEDRPPYPPFTRETALPKVQAAEDAWNTQDPQRVALAYTPDSVWRNRTEFVTGWEQKHGVDIPLELPAPVPGARHDR